MSNIIPINPIPGHPLKALRKFAADADRIVARHSELQHLPRIVRQKIAATKNRERIDKLIADAKRTATLSDYDETLLAWCAAALQRFDPESNYEDNDSEGNLKRSVIGGRIAMLVGAFPNGAPGDPLAYVTTMVEAVCTVVEELTLPALDAAIWEITGTMKFIPAASEMLEIINRQTAAWNERSWAIRDLADTSRRTVARIEALQRR